MTKLKSLQVRNLVLAGVALLLLVVLIVRPSDTSARTADEWKKLFPDFQIDLAQRVRIHQDGDAENNVPAKDIELAMTGDGNWVLTSHFDHPAATSPVIALLEGVADMRVRKLITTRPETFANYEAWGGFTDVTVLDREGNTLAQFALGKAAEQYPEVFSKIGEEGNERIVQTIKVTAGMASPDITSWVEPRLFPGIRSELMKRMDVDHPDGSRLVLVKRGEPVELIEVEVPARSEEEGAPEWWVAEPTPPGDADDDKASNLGRFFTGLRLNNIVARVSNDNRTEFGLDDQALRVAFWQRTPPVESFERRKLRIGKKTEDEKSYYVTAGDGRWVYTVPSYSLSDFFNAPADFKAAPPPSDDDGGGDEEGGGDGG